jgi:hypothetical protein
LAQSLIARTEADLSQPIPVVFNLSSWASKRQSIPEWLIQELGKYQVSRALGKTWIEREQLLLLLDGLDEVKAEYRNACVRALNQFIQTHGATEMVVCCRFQDYQALFERLNLLSAIYIQPLTSEQIAQYLEQSGDELEGVRNLLRADSTAQEMAKLPLMLSIMTLAFQGTAVKELPKAGSEECRYLLFNAYIERMFQRRRTTQQYSKAQAMRWLTWLAQRMIQESQTIFLIERIQPSCLQTKLQRWRYRLESTLIAVMILAPIGGLLNRLLYEQMCWGFRILSGMHFCEKLFPSLTTDLLIGGLGYALILGLFVGFSREIKTVETLKWSWQKAKKSFFFLLILGLIVGLISWVFTGMSFGLIGGLIWGVFIGMLYGIIGGLIGGMIGPSIQQRVKPNQGIWKSARNAWIVASIVGLIFGPPAALFGGVFGVGRACIQHFTLRLILYLNDYVPWNYARFLDYAAERLFLQKVGGGYIFVHRMLMEHFAQMKLEQERR